MELRILTKHVLSIDTGAVGGFWAGEQPLELLHEVSGSLCLFCHQEQAQVASLTSQA